METKRFRGSQVVLAGFLIVVIITAFVVLRMVQSTADAPATAPPPSAADSGRATPP
jgi:hypothetical protein